MSKRSDDWLAEFGCIANQQTEEIKELILDGSIEVCPCCLELSAYAYQDIDEYDHTPEKGMVAMIGACDMGSWQCGHCKQYIMEASSPLNSPLFTHEGD